MNFLVELFEKGYSYSSLNSYRSAISSTHEQIDGSAIRQHPLVTRVLKGAYNIRPPRPRYPATWRVADVIQFLREQNNESLNVLDLSKKMVVLLVLTWPCRTAEVANLDFNSIWFSPEGVTISPLTPPKQTRAGSSLKEYFFSEI